MQPTKPNKREELEKQLVAILGYCGNCYEGVEARPNSRGEPEPIGPCPCTQRFGEVMALLTSERQQWVEEAIAAGPTDRDTPNVIDREYHLRRYMCSDADFDEIRNSQNTRWHTALRRSIQKGEGDGA